jgi:hypothetical protein
MAFDSFWNLVNNCRVLQSLRVRLVSRRNLYGATSEDDPQTQRFLTTFEKQEVIQAWPHHLKYIEFDSQWDNYLLKRGHEGSLPTLSIENIPNNVLWIKKERHLEHLLEKKEEEKKEAPPEKFVMLTDTEIDARLEELQVSTAQCTSFLSASQLLFSAPSTASIDCSSLPFF